MDGLFLTREEIQELTAKVQHSAQRKVLNFMGIEHRTRPDGAVVVLRAHLEAVLGMKRERRPATSVEPNWAACNETYRRKDPK